VTIPEIRDRLFELAKDGRLPRDVARELEMLAEETRRKFHGRRAPTHHMPLTPEEAAEIAAYERTHPAEHLSEIAERFGTNQGRVSEVLYGKRE
jgi:DNA-binding MarR family transcriptional regulator